MAGHAEEDDWIATAEMVICGSGVVDRARRWAIVMGAARRLVAMSTACTEEARTGKINGS